MGMGFENKLAPIRITEIENRVWGHWNPLQLLPIEPLESFTSKEK